MPAVVGSMGSCDRARVIVVRATVHGRSMAVTKVNVRGGLVVLADM